MGFKRCKSTARLEGKVVLITGASAGIGKEAARDFARRGAKVIMACRNLSKTQAVAEDIMGTTDNKDVHILELDTSLMSSVRNFAKTFLERETRLDILVLNAGILGTKKKTHTSEGLEHTMATNHFGHFLLVNLLGGLLKKSAPSRVVVTASQGSAYCKSINPMDLNMEETSYGSFKAYVETKLCNVFMTKHLVDLFDGSDVTVNCFCPGLVKTEIFEKSEGFFTRSIIPLSLPFAGRTPEEGAQTLIYLAVAEEVRNVSGKFFVDCKVKKVNRLADDKGLVKKVWEESERIVQLQPEERRF